MLADRNNGRSVSRKGVWMVYFLRSWLQFEKRSTIFAQFRNKFWNQMKDVWSMTRVRDVDVDQWPEVTQWNHEGHRVKSVKLNVEILVTLEYQPINKRQLGRNRGNKDEQSNQDIQLAISKSLSIPEKVSQTRCINLLSAWRAELALKPPCYGSFERGCRRDELSIFPLFGFPSHNIILASCNRMCDEVMERIPRRWWLWCIDHTAVAQGMHA